MAKGEKASSNGLDEKIEGWTQEHGELRIFRTSFGTAVFKRPKGPDFHRYSDKISGDKGSGYSHSVEFALSCGLHPGRDELRELFALQPAIVNQVGMALLEMGGSDVEAEVKKA